MSFFKKIAAVSLIAALLLSACSSGDTSWAFRNGGTQISPGLYILYEISAFGEAEEKIAEDMTDYAGMKSSELLKQTVEGKLASDWVKSRADELVREHIAVQERFTVLGLSLNDAEFASIESSLGSVKASAGDFYEKNGISEVTLREYYTGYARKNRLFSALYGEGGALAVSDAELNKYIAENYALTDILLTLKPSSVPEGETKTLEQLISGERAIAEDYLARLKAGEEIEQLEYEWLLAQADEEQKSTITKPEKGELSTVISESMRASYGDDITDAALGAKVGDCGMVEDDSFFMVFKKLDILESSDWMNNYKATALREFKGDEYEETLTELAAALMPEINTAVIDRYKPEKLKLDL